jgi:hypothetical protein
MKTGRRQQAFETRSVRQRKRQVKHLPLVRKIPAECFRENAPHRRALARGDHAHRGTTVRAENAAELFQAPCGIREEHEAELTDHGVEGRVGEGQRLARARFDALVRAGVLCCDESVVERFVRAVMG